MKSMGDSLSLRNAKVAWVLPVLGGVAGNLLYNQALLESLAGRCGAFRVITAEFKGDRDALGFEVELHGAFKLLYQNTGCADRGVESYAAGVCLVTPRIIPALFRYHPNLIVTTEFSLSSLYALLGRQLIPRARLLLLVEARPRLTQGRFLSLGRKALRTLMVNRADAIITNNEDGRNYLTEDLHAPAGKVIVKPYLVSDIASTSDISKEKLLEHRSKRGTELPVRFLYVGRLLRMKGLQYALTSLAALLPEFTGRFVFEVVGDGPFRENLSRQVQELGLSQHVRFHGKQPYASIWEWYKLADVFLFPTLSDYRALAPFEALSMGLPIVASIYDGGINETVDAGRNGFSFDPRDTVTLSRILLHLIQNPGLLAEFSKRSLEISSIYTLAQATASLAFACQKALDCGPQ